MSRGSIRAVQGFSDRGFSIRSPKDPGISVASAFVESHEPVGTRPYPPQFLPPICMPKS